MRDSQKIPRAGTGVRAIVIARRGTAAQGGAGFEQIDAHRRQFDRAVEQGIGLGSVRVAVVTMAQRARQQGHGFDVIRVQRQRASQFGLAGIAVVLGAFDDGRHMIRLQPQQLVQYRRDITVSLELLQTVCAMPIQRSGMRMHADQRVDQGQRFVVTGVLEGRGEAGEIGWQAHALCRNVTETTNLAETDAETRG